MRDQMNRVGKRLGRPRWVLAGLLAVAVALVLAASACSDEKDDENVSPTQPAGTSEQPTAPSGIDYGSLSGELRIDGSSTVYPISAAMAEDFASVARGVRVNVALSGTGGGFELFCRGEIVISDASRPIKQEEIDTCAAEGITDIVEIQVAIDALTVVVNPSNDFANCLTVQQLHDLFVEGGAQNWSDIDASWPDEDIIFYYPGTDSGTYDYFVEEIIEGVDENAAHRTDGFPSENDNDLVTGVEGDAYSIGYFGFAYYQSAGSELKAVAVDGGGGCVEPTYETALDGSYTPLSRPLFIYTRESFLQERPEVVGFINFYLESLAQIVPEVGYVSLPDALLQTQVAKIERFLP